MADRTAWRICSANGWFSVFGKKKRGKKSKPGAPAHDDLVHRDFTATGPNKPWLTDITEHPTSEGKIYLCAVKDVWSNRIIGYSIADRMESSIAVDSAVSRRRSIVAGCVLHSDGGAISKPKAPASTAPLPHVQLDEPSRLGRATTPQWKASSACCRTS
jgi:putative transposase